MCGIAGFLGMNNDALLRKMVRIISHRGPDDEGFFTDHDIGLGHRRLSVIDLSLHGHQPMEDMESRAVISFNGEIYNFKEIRKELIRLGYRFRSGTDTEVVLNSYLAWKESCLSLFNGMFAFAIWDKKDKSLFLARDRLGIKPLYYAQKGHIFIFASEIKSIISWTDWKREVNKRALDYYFTFRHNYLEETLFNNIKKFLPAHFMRINITDNGHVICRKKKYWEPEPKVSIKDASQVENTFMKEIQASVQYRLISDVPIGAFFSGGLDSSIIAAIMTKISNNPVRTYTVGFNEKGFIDEIEPARFASKYLKTDHTECLCNSYSKLELIRIIGQINELDADPSLLPMYFMSKEAKDRIKVVLTGQGADEFLCGYERIIFIMYAWGLSAFSQKAINGFPAFLNIFPGKMLNYFFKYSSLLGYNGRERLVNFCKKIKDIGSAYVEVTSIFNTQERENLYGKDLKNRLQEENIGKTINQHYFPTKIENGQDLLNHLLYFIMKTKLSNDLIGVDSVTMAHSIEARAPFLDHNFVEEVLFLPSKFKVNSFRDKYILRKVAEHYLPASIAYRRKEHFFVPINLWLNNGLKSTVENFLSKENIEANGYLNPDYVDYARRNCSQGEVFFARQIWSILYFLIWHKIFIESDKFLDIDNNFESLEDIFPRHQ